MCDDILSLKREETFKSTEITEKQVYLHKKRPKTGEMEGKEGKWKSVTRRTRIACVNAGDGYLKSTVK